MIGDAQLVQRLELLIGRAAHAGHDAELGRHVAGERDPLAALVPHRQLADRRRAAVDREAQADFLVLVAVPRHGQRVVGDAAVRPGSALYPVRLHVSGSAWSAEATRAKAAVVNASPAILMCVTPCASVSDRRR